MFPGHISSFISIRINHQYGLFLLRLPSHVLAFRQSSNTIRSLAAVKHISTQIYRHSIIFWLFIMLMVFARRTLLSCALLALVRADEDVYIDGALSAGWEDWSWSSVINWAATDIVEGSSSVSVNSSAYGALSMYAETPFANSFAGLQFDILGDQPDVSLDLESTTDSGSISTIPVASMTSVSINSSAWTTILLDFSNLPPSGSVLGNDSWNRIDFQAGGNGAVVCLLLHLRTSTDGILVSSRQYHVTHRKSSLSFYL